MPNKTKLLQFVKYKEKLYYLIYWSYKFTWEINHVDGGPVFLVHAHNKYQHKNNSEYTHFIRRNFVYPYLPLFDTIQDILSFQNVCVYLRQPSDTVCAALPHKCKHYHCLR